MIIEKTGYGAGKRDIESIPNLLRVVMGNGLWGDTGQTSALHKDNGCGVGKPAIDDMNPEVFGFLMDRLFEQGALDVCWIPVFMKKNRPGTLVQVLCRRNLKEVLMDCILSETSTLGIRYYDAKPVYADP